MQLLKTGRQIGRTIRNAGRLREIVSVFAKHGFHNLAEKVKLGRYLLARLNTSEDMDKYTAAERLRMSFEELGPTFVKLGQLLASRPDLVPEDFVTEFSKLHDNVQPLPFEVIEGVLKNEFGDRVSKIYASIDPQPLGSASMAQVHRATLSTGQQVVIKVQRPGVIEKINDDLSVLYMLAELFEQYIPESRSYNPMGIVDEYFKTLELETNFVVEANNIRRFRENFAAETSVVIPQVNFDLTTERVLTMEALTGMPLSHPGALSQEGINSDEIIKLCTQAYFKMVFVDGFFHGDLHAGNFFVLPDNKIGLIDFGIVGRLSQKTRSSIASMLFAMAKEDYDQLAHEFVDLCPFSDQINVDAFAKSLRDLLSPYFGLTLKNVNLGKLLLKSGAIASRNGIAVPTELMLFFKSIVSVEGLGQKIHPDFDFLTYALDFSAELIKTQFDPAKIVGELTQFAKDSKTLLNAFPRQLLFLFRKWSSPNYSSRIRIENLNILQGAIEKSFRLLFLAILISALLGTGAFVMVNSPVTHIAGLPTYSFISFIGAAILGFFAIINYFRS